MFVLRKLYFFSENLENNFVKKKFDFLSVKIVKTKNYREIKEQNSRNLQKKIDKTLEGFNV